MTKPGYGTILNPMTLSAGLADGRISPGDTIYLRGGTYTGDFTCALNGASNNPILITAYQDEHPIIDGAFTINGSYTDWRNIEFMYSGWPTRIYESLPVANQKQLTVSGTGVRFFNNIIHDMFNVLWGEAAGLCYGNHIYYVGVQMTDRGGGHSLYTQNSTPRKTIKHNMMHHSFGWGIHAYTEQGHIDNFDFVENVCYKAGGLATTGVLDNILIGGSVIASGIVATGNLTYGGRNGIHEYGDGMDTPELSDNYLPDGWSVPDGSYTGNGNTLGTIGNTAFVYPDDYITGCGIIAVYNQSETDSVTVDVTDILEVGDDYTLRNAQDYYTDVVTGMVGEVGTISVDMRAASHSVAAPVNWDTPAKTFPEFGAFILEKTA